MHHIPSCKRRNRRKINLHRVEGPFRRTGGTRSLIVAHRGSFYHRTCRTTSISRRGAQRFPPWSHPQQSHGIIRGYRCWPHRGRAQCQRMEGQRTQQNISCRFRNFELDKGCQISSEMIHVSILFSMLSSFSSQQKFDYTRAYVCLLSCQSFRFPCDWGVAYGHPLVKLCHDIPVIIYK